MTMLRLYHAPLACSLASRLALTASGLPHEVHMVRTWLGEQKTDAYLRINPRGTVPALETDAGVLTESTAILPFIAALAPDKALFPDGDAFERARGQAWLSYLSSTLHVALAAAMFPVEGCETLARDAAMKRVVTAFEDIDRHLEGRNFLLGAFSVCDLYLLVFSLWRMSPALAGSLPSLPNIDRVQQILLARPGFAAILAEEMQLRAEAQQA